MASATHVRMRGSRRAGATRATHKKRGTGLLDPAVLFPSTPADAFLGVWIKIKIGKMSLCPAWREGRCCSPKGCGSRGRLGMWRLLPSYSAIQPAQRVSAGGHGHYHMKTLITVGFLCRQKRMRYTTILVPVRPITAICGWV